MNSNTIKDWFDLSKAEERALLWGIALFAIAILLAPFFSMSKIRRKKDEELVSQDTLEYYSNKELVETKSS